eukprot:5124959-Pyramimonas_sp.AAC.3
MSPEGTGTKYFSICFNSGASRMIDSKSWRPTPSRNVSSASWCLASMARFTSPISRRSPRSLAVSSSAALSPKSVAMAPGGGCIVSINAGAVQTPFAADDACLTASCNFRRRTALWRTCLGSGPKGLLDTFPRAAMVAS